MEMPAAAPGDTPEEEEAEEDPPPPPAPPPGVDVGVGEGVREREAGERVGVRVGVFEADVPGTGVPEGVEDTEGVEEEDKVALFWSHAGPLHPALHTQEASPVMVPFPLQKPLTQVAQGSQKGPAVLGGHWSQNCPK